MPPVRTFRLLVVDPHPVVREGLRHILAGAPDLHIGGETDTALGAIQQNRQKAWDIVVLELSLPDRDGLEVLSQLRTEHPSLRVMIFTAQPEAQFAVRSVKSGAAGFLSKLANPAQIVEALRTVAEGRKYVSPEVAQALVAEISGEASEKPHEGLSNREFLTLRLLASGLSVSGVAEKLSLSVKTVSMYRARLLAKMRMKNNAELTHYAIRHHLVD